ncbi:hypothetical protein [Arthrobacter sp. PsM3]|nr:hypothetical protein [Arthrobacter sp. PsM3]MDN4644962.1 hypothetical protein [Arthrobacter sp. PsM3]
MPAANDDAPDRELVAAIHTRRLIRCRRVDKVHVEGGACPSCGL